MAALRRTRAVHATGSFGVTAFRADDLSRLKTLQSLYACPDPDISPSSANAGTSVCESYHATAVSNWILGPHMSTEEIVLRCAPVF